MMKRLTHTDALDALALLEDGEMDGDPRATVLLSAALCVLKDRSSAYGEPEDNFKNIAEVATGILTPWDVTAYDVALFSMAIKLGRLKNDARHWDSYVDLIGYAACAAQVVQVQVEAELEEELGSAAEPDVYVDSYGHASTDEAEVRALGAMEADRRGAEWDQRFAAVGRIAKEPYEDWAALDLKAPTFPTEEDAEEFAASEAAGYAEEQIRVAMAAGEAAAEDYVPQENAYPEGHYYDTELPLDVGMLRELRRSAQEDMKRHIERAQREHAEVLPSRIVHNSPETLRVVVPTGQTPLVSTPPQGSHVAHVQVPMSDGTTYHHAHRCAWADRCRLDGCQGDCRRQALLLAQAQHFQQKPEVVGPEREVCCHKTVPMRCPGCPYVSKGLDAYRGE